jgi:S1-C subfamily serine protease
MLLAMSRLRRTFTHPFVAALLGGVLVAAAFLTALGAGWVGDDETTAAAPVLPSEPAATVQSGNQSPINKIYEGANDGVVYIEADGVTDTQQQLGPFGGPPSQGTATGSGFVLDTDGHILTNAHVVDGADAVRVTIGEGTDPVDAKVVGADPSSDIALLDAEADPSDLHPLPFGQSKDLAVGDPVVAIGNPLGLDHTATSGIVSALGRTIDSPNGFSITNAIQTDASINPGNSGGPLIDGAGDVVGVTSQIATAGGEGSIGIGFAVPAETANEVVQDLLDDGKVSQPFLGLTGGDIDGEIASQLDLPVDDGVLVQDVVPGGPADDAGIEGGGAEARIGPGAIKIGGDIITEVEGNEVDSMEDVINAVDDREPGDDLHLTILHNGDEESVTANLAERPAQATP